jgi:hypothetical protein
MTRHEFQQRYEEYPWDPYIPLAVFLKDGRRVYIDLPEQVKFSDSELIITRRSHPQKPERYPYAEITRLVPLDQLPAEAGGMSYAEFDPLIRELLMADPFRPFTIELKSGERIDIQSRPEIGRAGRFVKFYRGNERSSVTYEHIKRLAPQGEPVGV